MEEEKKKKRVLKVVGLVLCAVLVITLGSYAYWQLTEKQSNKNVVGTACLDIDIVSESGDISLKNAWPISDSEGSDLEPYTFTITNKCGKAVNYSVGLESIAAQDEESTSYLNYDYIRVKLDNGSAQTYGALDELTNDVNQPYIIRDTKEIAHHTLGANGSVTHSLRLWVDENTPLQEQDGTFNTEKYFYGKIRVVAGQNINGDEPVTIGVVNGDINTVGSEVQIGNEYFYVIGDDEEISGNVKLLAKYNLLVGKTDLGGSKDTTEEECSSRNGTWYGDGECDYGKITYDSSTSGYNRQSPEAKGAYCTAMYKKIHYYENVTQESCEAAGGEYRSKDGNECRFNTLESDTQYDNLTQFGTPDIDYECDDDANTAIVDFSQEVGSRGLYWADYQNYNYTLKPEYSLQNGQTMPYVYYDNNKNVDSNGIVAGYVNNYKGILEGEYRISISDARLLSFEEAAALGCAYEFDGKDYYNTDCSNAPAWLVDRTYWLGSSNPYHLFDVWAIQNYEGVSIEGFEGYNYKDEAPAGVRPVISVSKSIFNN